MAIFEKSKTSKGKTVYRWMFVAYVQNNIMRRVLLVIILPVGLILNTTIALLMIPLVIIRQNEELIKSIILRWKEPRKLGT